MQNRVVVTVGIVAIVLAVILFSIFGVGGAAQVTPPSPRNDATQSPDISPATGSLVAETVVANQGADVAARSKVGS